jgi:hypothetical protein
MRLAILLVAFAACADSKREAASLVGAVDRYRRAENKDKPEAAAALETVECHEKDVCDAKTACLAVSRPTARGLVIKREVEEKIGDLEAKRLDPDAEAAKALPEKLDEASRLLEEARAALPGCDAKILNVRHKYGL